MNNNNNNNNNIEVISGGDDSTPTSPINNKYCNNKSYTLSRVPTLSELKRQYSSSIARLDTLHRKSTSLNVVQHGIHSDGLISDMINHDDDNDDENGHKKLEMKLEKTWTLMLSHISRMDTQSTIHENIHNDNLDLDYLNMERPTYQCEENKNDEYSLSRKSNRRTSFFNGAQISMHTQRSVLKDQSLSVRLMNIDLIRWLYHFGSRASALSDQITDLVLLISLLISGAYNHASKYICFLLAPYFVLSLLLLAPLSRRMGITPLSTKGATIWPSLLLLSPIWLPCYLFFIMPMLIGLDFYIYFVLAGKDLATTRYLLYYWRLKVIVEILFESFPQTVFILTTNLSQSVNSIVVILSLCTSIGIFLWSIFKIYRGGRKTGLGTLLYFKTYYIEQGIEMIPYLEAIVQNNLLQLSLKERLQISEWKHMAKSLFFNFSIQKLIIHGQNNITPKVWSLLFYSLENNCLQSIDLTDCKLMGHKPVDDTKAQQMMELNDDDLANIVINTFNYKEKFNPFDKVDRSDDESSIGDISRFTRLITLYSLQRVINVSSQSLKYIQLTNNNFSCLTPFLLNTISNCQVLEKLDLSSNYIGLANNIQLKDSLNDLLTHCKSLKCFILNRNKLNDEFAKIFVAILTENNMKRQKTMAAKIVLNDAQFCDDINDNQQDTMQIEEKSNIEQEEEEEEEEECVDIQDIVISPARKIQSTQLKLLSLEHNKLTFFGAKTLLRACNASNISINLASNQIKTDQWVTLMGTMLIGAIDDTQKQ